MKAEIFCLLVKKNIALIYNLNYLIFVFSIILFAAAFLGRAPYYCGTKEPTIPARMVGERVWNIKYIKVKFLDGMVYRSL
jgi:hypothetical protein